MIGQAAADGQRVGALGDPARLSVEGAHSFSVSEIRRRLYDDLTVAAAACPDMQLAAFLDTLGRQAAEGYRCCGFPDIRAQARVERGGVVLEIDEGPRFLAGDVVVTGARAIDGGRLITELTASEPENPPVNPRLRIRSRPKKGLRWQAGEPARLGLVMQKHWHDRVADLVEHQGWLAPSFRLAVVPDRTSGLARLEINFESDGTPATIGEIEITGNVRNTRDEILTYLGLPPGAVLSGDLRERIENRLLESGRFAKLRVERASTTEATPATTLRIDLKEAKRVPRLSEALSREEETLVKFSQWCRDFEYGHEEILLDYFEPEATVERVMSPDEGLLVIGRGRIVDTNSAIRPDDFQYAFVANHERMGIYSGRRGRKMAAAVNRAPVTAQVGLVMLTLVATKHQLEFGFGTRSGSRKPGEQYCRLNLPQTAAAALAAAHSQHMRIEWNGNEMRLKGRSRLTVIDAVSGRLVRDETSEPARDRKRTWRVTTTRGEFAPRLRWIESQTAHFVNEADAERPVTGIATFLVRDALALTSPRDLGAVREAAPAIEKLLLRGFLAPADRLLLAGAVADHDKFSIPRRELSPFKTGVPGYGLAFFKSCGLTLANLTLERGTWPWIIAQAAALQLSNRSSPVEGELARLYNSPTTGPLCHWAMAEVMHAAGNSTLAQIYAGRALELLGGPKFREECGSLLSAGSELGQYLLAIGDAMRALDETEADCLLALCAECHVLDQEARQECREALAVLRANRGEPITAAMLAAAEHCWHARLAQQLENRLHVLNEPGEALERPLRQGLRKLFSR
jgi:hypothetical protein